MLSQKQAINQHRAQRPRSHSGVAPRAIISDRARARCSALPLAQSRWAGALACAPEKHTLPAHYRLRSAIFPPSRVCAAVWPLRATKLKAGF